jgi:hypothetical protein
MLTKARQWPLPTARSIQSTPPYYIYLKSILTLSYLHLRLVGDLFPSGFPTKKLSAFLTLLTRTMCAAYFIHTNK